jgi:hypothetical protein
VWHPLNLPEGYHTTPLPDRVSCIDGALFPCWSYEGHPELYSGKHHTTGHVVQVASDLAGDVRAISDPSSTTSASGSPARATV